MRGLETNDLSRSALTTACHLLIHRLMPSAKVIWTQRTLAMTTEKYEVADAWLVRAAQCSCYVTGKINQLPDSKTHDRVDISRKRSKFCAKDVAATHNMPEHYGHKH